MNTNFFLIVNLLVGLQILILHILNRLFIQKREHVSKLDQGTTTWSVCRLPWAVWITEFGFPTKITLPLVNTGSWLFAD